MIDDVGQASFIGASINRGTGGFPTLKKKKAKGKGKAKNSNAGPTPVDSVRVTKPSKTPLKPTADSNEEVSTEPIFVRSERVQSDNKSSSPSSLTFSPKELPTHGPGSEYNLNRGRQFGG